MFRFVAFGSALTSIQTHEPNNFWLEHSTKENMQSPRRWLHWILSALNTSQPGTLEQEIHTSDKLENERLVK
jgi:hypothetical protein